MLDFRRSRPLASFAPWHLWVEHVLRFTCFASRFHPAAAESTSNATTTTKTAHAAANATQRHVRFRATRIRDDMGSLAESLQRHRPFGEGVRVEFLDTNRRSEEHTSELQS